jgi:ATP-binding cassette subfamily C protein LapB
MTIERYKYSLADLGSVLTGALSQSAAPSEFRALDWVDTLDWTVDDLVQIMSPRGISIELIDWASIRESARALALRETVYLALSDDSAWVMSFDEESSRLRGISPDPSAVLPNNSVEALFRGSRENWKFFKCNRQSVENLAIFPGIETQWFWSTIWKNRGLYVQSALASFLTNFFALGTSLFSMIVYNRIIPSNALESLTVLVTGMMLLMVVDYAVRSIRNHFLSVAGIDSDLALADRLFAQVLDLQYKSRKGSVGALANTLKEFEHIREFFASATLVSLIDVPFAFIFLLAIMIIGSWMAVPVVLGILVLLFVTLYIQPRMKALAKHSFEDGQSKHSVLVESLTGLETIKLLGAGGFMRRRLRAVLERQADISEQTKENTHLSGNVAQTTQQLVQMAVVAIGAYLVNDGHFGYGAIIAATMLSGKALAPFAQVSQLLVRLNQINVSYEALNELMMQPTEHPQEKVFMPRGRFKGAIEFRNVSFTYPGQQQPVLSDVSFKIQPGERVAILGHVGSGKTTISRLIAGLYEADSGTILIDGVDVRQIAPSNVRENLGISMQDVWLMSATVEQNISLGAVDTKPEDILWAGNLAGVSEFVDRHPDGYKLVLRERGESLSGGQRQAISLARALVRRPAMIVLDEPTSSMDARSEQIFVSRFKGAGIESTLLVITHRTSLLTVVDRVIILENGKVAGMGTTEQFMKAQTDRNVAAQIVSAAAASNAGREVSSAPQAQAKVGG